MTVFKIEDEVRDHEHLGCYQYFRFTFAKDAVFGGVEFCLNMRTWKHCLWFNHVLNTTDETAAWSLFNLISHLSALTMFEKKRGCVQHVIRFFSEWIIYHPLHGPTNRAAKSVEALWHEQHPTWVHLTTEEWHHCFCGKQKVMVSNKTTAQSKANSVKSLCKTMQRCKGEK